MNIGRRIPRLAEREIGTGCICSVYFCSALLYRTGKGVAWVAHLLSAVVSMSKRRLPLSRLNWGRAVGMTRHHSRHEMKSTVIAKVVDTPLADV